RSHETLGYHEFVEKLSYEINDEDIVGLGLNDMAFYKQSVQMLKERKEKENKPIMATLISLSNHYPFDELDVYGEFDTGHLEGTEIANYLKSMNYADQALELFFAEMEKEGLLDNAAVVIYGDHHAKISQEDYELVFNYDPETESYLDKDDENYTAIKYANLRKVRRTPLIIWTKEGGLQETISRPMGMIDVFPTLANMLNIENPYQLGKDIFGVADNMVILPNGSFITSDYFYNSSNLKVYDIHNNELLMKKDEFPEELIALIEKVEEELEFSSKIIESNLIKYNQAASENQASE
ncbi:MAG TPA: sulfatase-like hydrolase/transferase, partial [Erysipelothrix sp.]